MRLLVVLVAKAVLVELVVLVMNLIDVSAHSRQQLPCFTT